MKTLRESILGDIEDVIKDGNNAVKYAIKKLFDCFDVNITKNTITLTYNEDNTQFQSEFRSPAILKEVPGNEKIIVKDSNLLYIRSGVTGKTLKRLVSKKPLMLIFKDNWFDTKAPEYSELKNCTIEADMIEFFYPVVFNNCTIKLNNTFIDFRNDILKSINDLKGLKLDTLNYKGVVLTISNTKLGNEIYLNKEDDKYMEKVYKVLESVFSEMIKKNRLFKVRIEQDWFIEYNSTSNFWHCSYGY